MSDSEKSSENVEIITISDKPQRPKLKTKPTLKYRQRVVRQKIKRIEHRKAKEARKLVKAREQAKTLEKLVDPKADKIIEPSITEVAPEILENEVIFKPNPGPQTEFLAATEKEVLYGGARGGGKSYAMLVDPLRYCDKQRHRFLLVRRTMPELRDLIYLSKHLYTKAFPGAKYREQEKEWIFPSGARGEFGYAENLDDAMRYQGQPYTWIGVDELAQFPSIDIWNLLRGSLRSTDEDVPTFMRATANPGGPGHLWVKKEFIDPAPPGQTFKIIVETPNGVKVISRRFIPAKLQDNPHLMKTDDYLIMLSSLPEAKRKQWLEGNWDAMEGAAFPEFQRQIHVVEPFKLPHTWSKFRSCDWGYSSPACVLWFAVDYDGILYVYREFYTKGLTADIFARRVRELEKSDLPKTVQMKGIMDCSVWSRRGEIGPSIPDIMLRNGCRWGRSDGSPRSRINGKSEVHRRLAVDQYTKKPRLLIFNTCTNLIATLPSLPIDKNNPEDVDTDAEDHAYDALRYGLMSRPLNPQYIRYQMMQNIPNSYRPADTKFGY